MATTADFRNGLCIEFKGALYEVVYFQHVKPGKGSAFVRTELKHLSTKKILTNTFNAGEKITLVHLERRKCQLLYDDQEFYFFMDPSFDTLSIAKEKIGIIPFVRSGETYELLFRDDTEECLLYELPVHVVRTVVHTEAGAKGNTATKATKPALLESGEEIQVPLFIKIGDAVKIDTASASYLSRAEAA